MSKSKNYYDYDFNLDEDEYEFTYTFDFERPARIEKADTPVEEPELFDIDEDEIDRILSGAIFEDDYEAEMGLKELPAEEQIDEFAEFDMFLAGVICDDEFDIDVKPATPVKSTAIEITEKPAEQRKPAITDKKWKTRKVKAKKLAKSLAKEVASWAAICIATVVAIGIINLYVIRPSVVSGHSMDPTLDDGQTIILSRLPYIFGDIERGDIVVIDRVTSRERTLGVQIKEVLRYNALTQKLFFEGEQNDDVFWVKRVIAIEGDTISFADGKVYLNGELLYEDYILTQEVTNYRDGYSVTLGENELFVMGDNRNGSADSRVISKPITCDYVVGKVVSGAKK